MQPRAQMQVHWQRCDVWAGRATNMSAAAAHPQQQSSAYARQQQPQRTRLFVQCWQCSDQQDIKLQQRQQRACARASMQTSARQVSSAAAQPSAQRLCAREPGRHGAGCADGQLGGHRRWHGAVLRLKGDARPSMMMRVAQRLGRDCPSMTPQGMAPKECRIWTLLDVLT